MNTTTRRLARLVALCLVGGTLLAGCGSSGSAGTSDASSDHPPVVIIGDSITKMSRDQILATTPPDLGPVTVFAEDGRQTAQMAAIVPLSVLADAASSWFVVDLGTNDAGFYNESGVADFKELVNALSPSPCVVLVTVNERFGSDFIAPAIAVAINDEIYRIERSNDNVHVYDWNAAVHGPPDRAEELLSDEVHPNDAGRAMLADGMWDTLTSQCAR